MGRVTFGQRNVYAAYWEGFPLCASPTWRGTRRWCVSDSVAI